MTERLRVGVIFGGLSVEHEVSVVSAEHFIAAADPDRFEVVPIGVTSMGHWLSPEETRRQLEGPGASFKKRIEGGPPAWPLQGIGEALAGVDVVFPLIHGAHGEDGTLQGLLELAGLPYVGCGVAASAIGMDKALMKAIFRDAGIAVAEHRVVRPSESKEEALALGRELEEVFGLPVFVKPCNGGSSVGVFKARDREELASALLEARQVDRKLVVERMVVGREVECGIVGNGDELETSAVGEVHYEREFYDFEAKYLDPRSQIIAPAEIPEETADRVRDLALRAFRAIDASGFSRVDFFLCPDGSLVIDEINTIPGFTPESMFPRLWQTLGVSYSELITRLVGLAMARHEERPIV